MYKKELLMSRNMFFALPFCSTCIDTAIRNEAVCTSHGNIDDEVELKRRLQ